MDSLIQYTFRNKTYSAEVFLSFDEEPYLIFVILQDKELFREFGDEISIKTDCEKVLPKKDSYRELEELRQALFDAIITTPEFVSQKQKRMIRI